MLTNLWLDPSSLGLLHTLLYLHLWMLITPFHYGRYQQDTLRSRNHTTSCITKHSLSYLKRPHVDLNKVLITHVQQPSKHVFTHSANVLNVNYMQGIALGTRERKIISQHTWPQDIYRWVGATIKKKTTNKQIIANEWNACDNENICKLLWRSWYEKVGTKSVWQKKELYRVPLRN